MSKFSKVFGGKVQDVWFVDDFIVVVNNLLVIEFYFWIG